MDEILSEYSKLKVSSKKYTGVQHPIGWGHWYERKLDVDEDLWRLFAKMAMLEYSFYRATGIEVDRVKPKSADGAVELFDKKSSKTLEQYFATIKDPALKKRALGLAKDMATFSKAHTSDYGLYREIKSLLPRFWTYHWEFHDLLFSTNNDSAEKDNRH